MTGQDAQAVDDGSFGPERALLDGRVAVVTGGARGIGAATAITLARFGADVAICDKLAGPMADVAAHIEGLGRTVTSVHLDVRDAEAVTGFASQVAERHGRVDVLVNNAGGGFWSPFVDVSPKGQAALVAENFVQVTTCIREFVPLMVAGGSIVNVTSIEGHRAGPGFAIYSAMKAALENLTKSLALELSDRRIRVNCVAPDMIPTPGDADLVADSGAMGDAAAYAQPWPDGGTTWDCASAILFLAGDLSRFMTGSTLHVDGGTFAASGWKRTGDGWGL